MSDYIPIIVAIFGSGGLFTLIQFIISRKDNKDGRLKRIESKIDELDKKYNSIMSEVMNNVTAITRLQLLWLIKTQPKNHDTILKTAERYFVKLNGDAEAFDEFYKWKNQEGVNIIWFDIILSRENNLKKGVRNDQTI